jgi:DNA mismatch repair protein MutL
MKTDENGKIRLLDDATINQIAAGEVVERPASVVKELVENSIDAGASTVRVEITSDTREIRRIQVVDDGRGMAPDDALRSFLRHATSKLNEIEDLGRLRTMGFRGEALASIAAVARLTMITKPRGEDPAPATKIEVEAGDILAVEETGAPDGTSITVTDLFFNTPARKKFLKSLRTELSHIYAIIEQISLAHPDVSFTLLHNGQAKIRTPRAGDLFETIIALHGSELARDLIGIRGRTAWMEITGYISKPSQNRPGMQQIEISVNDRQISSIPLARAVRKGYGTLLPKDRYPVAFLHIDLDTAIVDVNVHPTKKEIRLSRENEVIHEVARIVTESLMDKDLVPDAPEDGNTLLVPEPDGIARPPEPGATVRTGVWEPAGSYRPSSLAGDSVTPMPLHGSLSRSDAQLRLTEQRRVREKDPGHLPAIAVIGQLDATYILASSRDRGGEQLLIIDQHAAHERILYEIVLKKRAREVESQELITPVVLSLRPRQAAAVRGAMHILMDEGFILEEFGTDAFAVRTVPVVLGKQVEQSVLEDILSDILEEQAQLKSAELRKELITTIIACRGAIKAGTVLTQEQMERLVTQLFTCTQPYTCPHGRPTVIAFSRAKLDGMFKRA